MNRPSGTSRRRRPRGLLAWITALLLLTGSLLVSAVPAGATENGLLDATCIPPSSSDIAYTPPLTNTPQPSSAFVSWQLGPCVSTSVPGLTSGTSTDSVPPRSRSCLDLLAAGTETKVVTWNTGATSTLSMNRTVTVAGAVVLVTHTGTVTSGLFAGDTVVATETAPATDITLCTLGLGTVGTVYGVMTLEITSV
ncbi:hypothetical protein [Streptomyces nitrosporeus]|uniref:hypothetical protein n=1 Tax=Streptomyces nitrosporeus TaxID=28894 RepID=UPI0039A201A6